MGQRSHSVEMFGEPFVLADEMIFLLPKGGSVTIEKDQFKLLFVIQAEVLHDLDGMNGPRPLRTGDILVCPHFRWHRFINPDPHRVAQPHIMRLFLDGEAIRRRARVRRRRPESNLSDFAFHHFSQTVQCEGAIDSHINGCLTALRRETEDQDVGFRHRVRNICTDLLVAVARKVGDGAGPKSPSPEKGGQLLVVAAKEYILKNIETPLTLGEIAWNTGKGEEHLARTFKKETGQSVFDFVREARINRSKTFLLDTSLNLTQIAERSGFNSLSFFSRSFRDLVGMAPSDYRKHIQSEVTPGPRR